MKLSFLLLIFSSILFYGVVGKDKTWLLVPCFILNNLLIFIWILIKFTKNKVSSDYQIKNILVFPKDLIIWFIFCIFSLILIFFSSIPYESKNEFFYLSSIFGTYVFFRNDLVKFKEKNILFGFFLTFVLILSIYGIILHVKYPDAILWSTRYTDHYDGRLSSCYICPNHFAHLIQMLIPFCLCYLFIPKGSFYLKILCIYSLVIFIPALFLTESRAGWLGSITSISILICAFSLLRSKKLFFSVLLSIPILISLIFILSWNYSETFQRRMKPVVNYFQEQSTGGIGSDSKDFRPQTWKDTFEMIKEKPILGFGPGTYNYTFQKYRKSFKGERIVTGHPHNEYLELISDYGIVGFILFSYAWIYSLYLLIKTSINHERLKYKLMSFAAISMMFGTMVHSFFDFQMHIYPNAMTFCFLMSLGYKLPTSKPDDIFVKNNRKIISFSLILSFLIFLTCTQLKLSSLFLTLSKQNFSENALSNSRSKTYSLISSKINSKNWESFKQLGNYYYNKRYYSLSREEKLKIVQNELKYFNIAHTLNPYDAEIKVSLSKALIFLGRYNDDTSMINQGIDYLRNACDLKKYNNVYSWLFASELRKNNFLNDSLSIFKKMNKYELESSINANIEWISRKLENSNKLKNNFNHSSYEYVESFDILEFLKNKN